MARKKNYDRELAIESAMLAFWRKGFSNVGVRQIESETSINRFALQTEFGGKQGLFLEVLKKYLSLSDETALKPLQKGGLDVLIDFFQGLATGQESDPRNMGCLMVNTIIENSDIGMENVQQIITDHYDNMQKMFEFALKLARDREEIKMDFDIHAASKTLLTFAMGVEVYIRMKSDVNAVKQQVEFWVSEIESWRINNT